MKLLPFLAGFTLMVPTITPGQVGEGAGWTLLNQEQVTSLSPGTYTIHFNSTAARDRLKGYFELSAGDMNLHTTGVTFVVSDQLKTAKFGGCQEARTIVVTLEYRPIGLSGTSWGGNCYNLGDHSLHSGLVRIDEEWWYPQWFSTSPAVNGWYYRNGVAHELGHAVGLGHPNKDLDGDGNVEPGECEKNVDDFLPVMCSPGGGFMKSVENGKYTPHDQAGLRALVNNWEFR